MACLAGTNPPTQPDPIGLAGGLNLYGYAGGDPINFSDPFGLEPCRVTASGETHVVDDAMALDFYNAVTEARDGGYSGGINETFRTQADQTRIYSARGQNPPATSAHRSGTAVDMDWESVSPEQRAVLAGAMRNNGFERTYSGTMHWEHSSTRGNLGERARKTAAADHAMSAAGGNKNALPTCQITTTDEGQQMRVVP